MLQVLSDKLVRKFSIDASASGWGVLFGTVRPATVRETRSYTAALAKAKDEEYIDVQAKFYATHITSWNLPVDISEANIVMLPVPLWDQLESTVLGFRAEPILGNSGASSGS